MTLRENVRIRLNYPEFSPGTGGVIGSRRWPFTPEVNYSCRKNSARMLNRCCSNQPCLNCPGCFPPSSAWPSTRGNLIEKPRLTLRKAISRGREYGQRSWHEDLLMVHGPCPSQVGGGTMLQKNDLI